MKIHEVNKILLDESMQNKNCNFKLIKEVGGRITNHDILVEMRQGFARQEKFNELILARIDNLVAKNNLKE